jgi:glucose/arabinose dehydrogenase
MQVEGLESRRLFATLPSGFLEQTIATFPDQPTAGAFAPDGRYFVTLEGTNDTSGPGNVRVIKNNTLLATPLLTVTTQSFFERGLLGIAVHPNFASNGFVYVYYTLPGTSPVTHRVERWTVPSGSDVATPGSATTIFDIPVPSGQSSAGNHNGGAMAFGPDGKLYVSIGDNAVTSNSQNLNNLFGKVLRLNDDGSIPSDNPFLASTTGSNRAIWAVGLRNPFTFSFQPGTGRMYINDVGSSGSNRREEVNLGVAGANYGWPTIEGFRTTQPLPSIGTYRDPVHAYNDGFAITGSAFYNPTTPMFPTSFEGRYFYGDYASGFFRSINPEGTPPLTASSFGTGASGPLDFDVAPDGSLWYLEYNAARLRRIFVSSSLLPTITDQPQNATVSLDEPVTFSVTAGGPGTVQVRWQRDGVDIPGAIGLSYTLNSPTAGDNGATFRAVASNSSGQVVSNSATLTVLDNHRPDPEITAPLAGSTFVVGQQVNFAGFATDREDGDLPPSAYDWVVRYTTGAVTRPPILEVSGITSGSFVPEVTPAHRGTDVTYEILLTATDSVGAQRTVVRTLTPVVADVTLASNVPGATLFWDGSPFPADFTFSSIVGRQWAIAAPPTQTVGGQAYVFQNWSNGGSATQTITVPPGTTAFTANYLDVMAPDLIAEAFVFDGFSLPQPPHRINLTFSENVSASLSTSDLALERVSDGATIPSSDLVIVYDSGTNTASVRYTGNADGVLPDGNYRLTVSGVGVTDATGNPLGSDRVFTFFVLAGDADRNRSVDIGDFSTLAANFNAPGTFVTGDFNYSGTVDIGDFSLLAARFNTSLPAGRAVAGVGPAPFGRIVIEAEDDKSDLLSLLA